MKSKLLILLSLFAFVGGVKAQNYSWTFTSDNPLNGGDFYIKNANSRGYYINGNSDTKLSATPSKLYTVTKSGSKYNITSDGKNLNDKTGFTIESKNSGYKIALKVGIWYFAKDNNGTLKSEIVDNADNVWLFISPEQLTKKATFENTYSAAEAFSRNSDLTQDLLTELSQVLNANKNAQTSTYTARVNALNAIIDKCYLYLSSLDTDNDASDEILNANGNYDPKYHWTCTGNVNRLSASENKGKDGVVGIFEVGDWWASSFDCKMEQTINDLPNGFYRLSVDCQASKNSVLKIYAGNKEVTTVSKGEGWETYTTDVVEVTNGTLTIGAQGTANATQQWTNVDNFKLTYLGDTKASLSCKADKYSTFVAPFEVTLPEGVTAWSLGGVDGTNITLEEMPTGSTVNANTPVIIKNGDTENLATATYYGDDKGDHADQPDASKASLVGQYSAEGYVPQGAYVLQTQNGVQGFYKVGNTAVNCVANRCYLVVPTAASGVKAFSLGDDVDAIEAIQALTNGESKIYDLNGRQLKSLQKGINIVNGHKIMVK